MEFSLADHEFSWLAQIAFLLLLVLTITRIACNIKMLTSRHPRNAATPTSPSSNSADRYTISDTTGKVLFVLGEASRLVALFSLLLLSLVATGPFDASFAALLALIVVLALRS